MDLISRLPSGPDDEAAFDKAEFMELRRFTQTGAATKSGPAGAASI
jgi:hypothetical protein